MTSQLIPYLNFKDTARQAMEFYHGVFGGKVEFHTFAEYNASPDGSENDKIMHSMIEADNGITFMAADTPNAMQAKEGSRISMSLSGDNEAELRGYWDKLVEEGSVLQPLEKAPWGDSFGALTDKFGIEWMVNISAAKPE